MTLSITTLGIMTLGKTEPRVLLSVTVYPNLLSVMMVSVLAPSDWPKKLVNDKRSSLFCHNARDEEE